MKTIVDTEPISYCPPQLHPDLSKGPWALVRLFTKKSLPESFNLDQVLSNLGITVHMIPNIVAHKTCGSWEIVIATSALGLVSEKLSDFQLIIHYNPFEPAEDEICIHGMHEATEKAQTRSLNNAVESIHKGWRAGALECYLDAAKKVGLESVLERAILNRNIQKVDSWTDGDVLNENDPQIIQQLQKRILAQHEILYLVSGHLIMPASQDIYPMVRLTKQCASRLKIPCQLLLPDLVSSMQVSFRTNLSRCTDQDVWDSIDFRQQLIHYLARPNIPPKAYHLARLHLGIGYICQLDGEQFTLYSWKELSGDSSTLELNLKPESPFTSGRSVLQEIGWIDIIETNRLRLSCDMKISEVRDLNES